MIPPGCKEHAGEQLLLILLLAKNFIIHRPLYYKYCSAAASSMNIINVNEIHSMKKHNDARAERMRAVDRKHKESTKHGLN